MSQGANEQKSARGEDDFDMEEPKDFDYEVRYTILGAPASGKTAFRMQCVDDMFLDTYVPTVGVDQSQRVCKFDDDRVVMMLYLVDGPSAGSSATWNSSLRQSDGLCLVFDVTQKESFDALKEILQGAQSIAGNDLALVVVGTKFENDDHAVTQTEIDAFVAEIGAKAFVGVNSKSGAGIEEAVKHMAQTKGSNTTNGNTSKSKKSKTPSTPKNTTQTTPVEETKEMFENTTDATKTFEILPSLPLSEILAPFEAVTARRVALLEAHLATLEEDIADEASVQKCRSVLDNGIQVVKFHRGRHGEPASRFLWLDSEKRRLCMGAFGEQKNTANPKFIALTDIAEIRCGAESYAFMASSRAPPESHDYACLSIIGTNRTFDISLYPDGPATVLAKALKIVVDATLNEQTKEDRGKLSLSRATTITRRSGPPTHSELAEFDYFKNVLVRGITVLHHTKRIIAMEKFLWLDPHTGRLNLGRFKNSMFGFPDGLYLIDIAEVRPGRNADTFQNEVYPRRTVTDGMCLSIIGSEATLCVSFVSAQARNLFMHKLQALLRVLRPDLISY